MPVVIEVLDRAPAYIFDGNDLVTDASLEVPSGRIVIAGCTEYFPDAQRIPVSAGWYRVRICYKDLDTLSANGLDGDDSYRVVLWRTDARIEPLVRRDRRKKPTDGR